MTENTNFDISKHFQTPLASLALPRKYIMLIKQITRLDLEGVKVTFETVGDVFMFDSYQLFQLRKFERQDIEVQYIELFIEFKKELSIILSNEIPKKEIVVESIEQLNETIEVQSAKLNAYLYHLNLSPQYQKLIKRISHSIGIVNTVQDVLDINAIEFAKQPAVGKLYIDLLVSFQNEFASQKISEEIKKTTLQTTLSVDQLETPLNKLALSQQYEKLIKRISGSMGVVNTVQDILGINLIEFSKVSAVGIKYVELLVNLQNELTSEQIKIEPEIIKEIPPKITLSVKQLETPINQIALSAQYKRLIGRISNAIGDVYTAQDILNINPVQFSELPAIGKSYVNQLIEFQKKLPDFLEKQTQKSSFFTENYSIEFNEIDNVLIEDIEDYLWTLDKMKMDIALSRWGFNQQYESLEDVGKRYQVTRERIRQIEKPINANLPLNFRIQPKVLWTNIREKMTDDLTVLLPNLAKCFATEKLFYDFIERCCQVENGSISEIVFAKISSKIMNLFFCFNPSPISQEIIINELMSNYGYSKASAANGLKQLAKNDRIEITTDGIYPKNLGKIEAISHVLTFHPLGLPWKDIARIINIKGYSSTLFDETRTATGFHRSEYIYLCGQGTFRHLMFLDLKEFNIPEIMQHLLDYFEQKKLSALHLHDYFQQTKNQRSEIEYFTLRHIVREYGEEYGVFFNGKSSSDSISIDKNAKRIIQADVIVNMLNESSVAMTVHEIAERLRSKSTSHAGLYLNNLIEEGRVVRVDHLVYTTPEKAFSKIDVDAVMRIIKNVMNVGKIVEADIFREYVNMELNLSYSKYIYAALVRTKLNELGWCRNGTLFSENSIPYKNLADAYDQLCEINLSNSENIQNVLNVVWLTDAVAANALQWWKSK